MDYLEQRRKLRQMVQERLDYGRDYTDEEVEDTIDEVLMEQENLELCSVELRRRLRKELFDSLRRLDILQIFVDDSSVTEIMIKGRTAAGTGSGFRFHGKAPGCDSTDRGRM